MIIPIRCFTCGKVLADKWVAYERKVKITEEEIEKKQENESGLHENFDDPFRGKILDDLGIVKICCRRHMLGHVDMIDII